MDYRDIIKENNRIEKEGLQKKNNKGNAMTLIKYNNARDILVQFENGKIVKSSWGLFKRGSIIMPEDHVGQVKITNEGYNVKVIEYNSYSDIIVEFQDEWRSKVHTTWYHFKNGTIKNRYHPNKYGGIVGDIRPISSNGEPRKEYRAWMNILTRCYNPKLHASKEYYSDCEICKEWKYYWNFYDWVHKQSNFNKWINGDNWAVDKDISIKNNKIYSPTTCFLVPQNVNNLLLKADRIRGELPVGVSFRKTDCTYEAQCNDPFEGRYITIGVYISPNKAFIAYKKYKENIIKKVAQNEYQLGNITKECYDALIRREINIDD